MENRLMCLINRKQFVLATLVGGPFIAGFIAALNLWRQNKKWKSFLFFFAGLLLNLAMEGLMIGAVFGVLLPLGLVWNYLYNIPLFILSQLLFYFIINLLLRIKGLGKTIFPEIENYYGIGKGVIMFLVSIVYLSMHMVVPMLIALFSNIVLLIYLVPHIYFFNKSGKILNSSRSVIIGRWVVVLIALYMPLIFMIGDFMPIEMFNIPVLLAEYYIYVLLYIFLFSLTLELIGFVLRKSGLIPLTILNKGVTRIVAVLIVFASLIFVLITGSIRYNNIAINNYSIQVPKKNTKLDSLKIAFVADMHLNENTGIEFVKEFVGLLKDINPDVVLTGGDMVENGRISLKTGEEYKEEHDKFEAKFGSYSIGGNHDGRRASFEDTLHNSHFLSDTMVKVADSFWVMGLRYRAMGERPVADLMKLKDEDLPVLLLDHAPYCLYSAYENGIDVQMSGHTHNGQVWPLNYIVELMYELSWGYKRIKETHFFVTSGIRGWGASIRTTGQSEIMVINIEFQ